MKFSSLNLVKEDWTLIYGMEYVNRGFSLVGDARHLRIAS